jgi:hypothetical protein
MSALRDAIRRDEVKAAILKASRRAALTEALLDELILRNWPRGEKVVSKDIKIRTFIGQESMRNQLASHVYDITYGSVRPGVDNLVCVDDSIVRGTTLRRSILRILARLNPRKIVIVSTAPQIRYPDCYGIDMSEIGKFVAFEAVVDLQGERPASCWARSTGPAARRSRPGAPSTTCAGSTSPSPRRRSRRGSSKLVRPAEHRVEGGDRDHLPDDREPARGRPQPHRRLVLHGPLSDARGLPGGEPGLRELLREERGTVLLAGPMSLSYESSGVRYGQLDAFKRACQRAALTTADLLAGHGFASPRRAGRERVPDRGRRPLHRARGGGPRHEEPRGRRRAGETAAVPLPGDRHRHRGDDRERPDHLRRAPDRGRHARRRGGLRLVRGRAPGQELVAGFAEGCRAAGRSGAAARRRPCGARRAEAIILAGSAVGRISPKSLRIVGRRRDGDAIIFLASSASRPTG